MLQEVFAGKQKEGDSIVSKFLCNIIREKKQYLGTFFYKEPETEKPEKNKDLPNMFYVKLLVEKKLLCLTCLFLSIFQIGAIITSRKYGRECLQICQPVN